MATVLIELPNEILTPRLRLCPPYPGGGVGMNLAIRESAKSLQQWMPWANPLPTPEESEAVAVEMARKFQERSDLPFWIFSREGNQYLGGTGLHRINWEVPRFEIGYWIRTSCEGQGFVTEAANAMTRLAFDWLKAYRVEIRCDSRNQRSLRVMQRLGFVPEGHFRRDARSPQGELRDTLIYARIDKEGLPRLEIEYR